MCGDFFKDGHLQQYIFLNIFGKLSRDKKLGNHIFSLFRDFFHRIKKINLTVCKCNLKINFGHCSIVYI